MIWLDVFLGPDEHIKPLTNGYKDEDEITQENPMKLEDRPETYTPTTHSLDGNDNQITKNSNRKTIDHKMTKKGIYTIQKLGIIKVIWRQNNNFFVFIFEHFVS